MKHLILVSIFLVACATTKLDKHSNTKVMSIDSVKVIRGLEFPIKHIDDGALYCVTKKVSQKILPEEFRRIRVYLKSKGASLDVIENEKMRSGECRLILAGYDFDKRKGVWRFGVYIGFITGSASGILYDYSVRQNNDTMFLEEEVGQDWIN